MSNDNGGRSEKWYKNTKRINVREIDFRQVLDHWDNECPQVNQPCRGSDFEFLSKPRSSEPDSSEQGSSGQDIVYSVHLKCKQCSREWAIEDLQVQQFEQPSCCASTCCNWCLQESDTGEYIPWKKVKDVLHPGDHVTWLRPVGYWHHGIVDCVNDDGSVEVWEWNVNGIGRSNKKECDVTGNCCWSPMYKSYYTDDMERENPPMLTLLRAKYREGERGYSLCKENCEHMATYSKTGASQCNQIRQFSLSLVGWLLRLLLKLVLFGLVVILSEVIEVATKPSKEVIGIITLTVFELLYVVLCVVRIYYEAKRVITGFICPSVKVFLQTILALGLSILCGVCLGNEVQKRLNLNESGTDRWKVAGFEIWFGILGGVIGNSVGFWLFSWLPWPYWCSWKGTLGKTKATEARPDRDEQEMAQGTTSV